MEQADYEPVNRLESVMHANDLERLQAWVRTIKVSRQVATYVVNLATATRQDARLRVGCSPRGCKMLLRASQAHAGLNGRDFVLPDDVQHLAATVLGHRVSSKHASSSLDETKQIIDSLVEQLEIPL